MKPSLSSPPFTKKLARRETTIKRFAVPSSLHNRSLAVASIALGFFWRIEVFLPTVIIMNGMVCFFFAVVLACTAVNAGPYYPYGYSPYSAYRNYYYNNPVAPLAAPAPVAAAPLTGSVPGLYGDYYSYATAAALGYTGYPYNYPYMGAYNGYPLLKKK